MVTIHCPRCARDFVDSRDQMADGDQAICPHCGARHLFRCADAAPADDALREPRPLNGTAAMRPKAR